MWLLIKNSLLRIKDTIGRFFSLFFIVALGLGFFAGIKATSKDMYLTADKYYDNSKLYDYKIVSTYGLTQEDLNSLTTLPSVKEVEGAYSKDVLVNGKVYRIHSIMDNMNKFVLKEGKLPQEENECLAEFGTHKIGDTIKIDSDEHLKYQEYKVVGLVESPIYIGLEKGISNIGNGKLNSYIYILKENFDDEFYTEAYLIGHNTQNKNSYDESYTKETDKILAELKKIKPIRETLRYEEILEKITNEITKNEQKIQEEEKKNKIKLANAKEEIDEAQEKLNDGTMKLANAKKEITNKEINASKMLDEQEKKIIAQEIKLQTEINNYNNSKENIKASIEEGKKQLNILKVKIDNLNSQIESLKKTDPDNDSIIILTNQRKELQKKYDENSMLLNKQEQEFKEAPAKFQQAQVQIDNAKKTIAESKTKLKEEINNAKNIINKQEQELYINNKKLLDAKKDYNAGLNELNLKIAESYDKISQAKAQLDELPKPVWYLLDRTDQAGYIDFKHDAMRVDNIAKVFPAFFLLVAALVCLNTMSRMVEEDRTEIGIYKALGYSNFHIIITYFSYVTIATLFGGIFGLLIGYQVFPRAIYSIYKFTYTLPELVTYINPIIFSAILLISLVITLSVTLYSCHKELLEEPANLLRPKAPKNGKKVFLEHIPFIWNKLNFSSKVTVRNLFRYKKRIFMTIIGIAGCTALTLTGFGLKDGISSIITKQYTDIFTYDALGVLSDKKDRDYSKTNELLQKNNLINPVYVNQELYNFKVDSKQHDFFLIVPESKDKLLEYISLHERINKKTVNLTDNGAIITEKMANLLNVKIGDNIKIRNSDNKLFLIKVDGIIENYTYHYVYMTKEYYEKVIQNKLEYNMVLADIKGNSNTNTISSNLINSQDFLNITFTKDTIQTFDTMISSLNKIVLVIIISSCLLAIIVLYNLTNINIIERKRELATLKVLGFYNKEVSSYVYRETMLLTLLGIATGLVLGIFLHRFVMHTAEMDFIMFLKEIQPISYVYATIITIVFSLIVEIFTHFKLKKIDMIESLKSVE